MRARRSRFRSSDKHAYRLELQLEFAESIGSVDAQQVARRIVEALRMSPVEISNSAGLEECRIVSHELRSVTPLTVTERTAQ